MNPVQIATIADNRSIVWNIAGLLEVLRRANGNNIKIVILIGKYQIGKTSFISAVTRNLLHVIGNGENETTNGATIDGPYTIQELINDRNIIHGENIPNNESIFFIDIEGYDGTLRGNREEQYQFFSNLCVPFVAISSCIVFLCEKNESQSSLEQIMTALRYNDFTLRINNLNDNILASQVVLMNLIRNITDYENISFIAPNEDNYRSISNLLTTHWQRRKFGNVDFTMHSKPLPLYLGDIYNTGLNFVISDLISTLINIRNTTNNPNYICEFFSSLCNSVDSFDTLFIQNENRNFYIRTIIDKVRNLLNRSFNEIAELISTISEEIKNGHDTDDLSNRNLQTIIRNRIFSQLESIIMNEIEEKYLHIDEVQNFIEEYKSNFDAMINLQIKEIILYKIQHIKNIIVRCINLSIINKINELKKTNILKYIPEDPKKVFNCFHSLFSSISNQYLSEYILRTNIQYMAEFENIKRNMHNEIDAAIRIMMPELMKSLKKKKGIQIFIKVLIGIAISIPSIALIGTGIGAGVLASIYAVGAVGTATTATLGGTAAFMFSTTIPMIACLANEYPDIKELLNDKKTKHLFTIFNPQEFDFDYIREQINRMENTPGNNVFNEEDELEDI